MYTSSLLYHTRGFPEVCTGTFTRLQTWCLLRCLVLPTKEGPQRSWCGWWEPGLGWKCQNSAVLLPAALNPGIWIYGARWALVFGSGCHWGLLGDIPGQAAHSAQPSVHTGPQRQGLLFSYSTHLTTERCLLQAGRGLVLTEHALHLLQHGSKSAPRLPGCLQGCSDPEMTDLYRAGKRETEKHGAS